MLGGNDYASTHDYYLINAMGLLVQVLNYVAISFQQTIVTTED